MDAGADTSRQVNLDARADKSRLTWLSEPKCLEGSTWQQQLRSLDGCIYTGRLGCQNRHLDGFTRQAVPQSLDKLIVLPQPGGLDRETRPSEPRCLDLST